MIPGIDWDGVAGGQGWPSLPARAVEGADARRPVVVAPRMQAAPAAPTAPTAPDTERPDTERDDKPKTHVLPPYKVLLYNDDHNSMDHVVRSLVRSVPKISRAQAMRIMLEAHFTGVALVIVCPLEHAELYRDRLQSCGLTASIEPA